MNHYEDANENTRCKMCGTKVEGGYCSCVIQAIEESPKLQIRGKVIVNEDTGVVDVTNERTDLSEVLVEYKDRNVIVTIDFGI